MKTCWKTGTDQPYTLCLDAEELENDNELVMVAENPGSMPMSAAAL